MRIRRPLVLTGYLLAIVAGMGGCRAGTGPPISGPAASTTRSPAGSPTAPSPPVESMPTGPSPVPSRAGSGITGRITIDGGCPVITERGCPDRPYLARITVTGADSGLVIATVVTGTDGAYRIALPSGRYLLHVANPQGSPYPMAQNVTVTVPADRYVTEDVRLDSGIR